MTSDRRAGSGRHRATVLALAVAALASCGAERAERGSGPRFPGPFTILGRWSGGKVITFAADGADVSLSADDLTRALARAAAPWEQATPFRFRMAGSEGAADVVVSRHGRTDVPPGCVPFVPLDGPALAHTGPPRPGTFIHLNRDVDFSGKFPGTPDLVSVLCHEIGHVLGLGHAVDPEAVMAAGWQRRDALAECDLAAVHSLFGGGEDAPGDVRIEIREAEGGPFRTATVLRRAVDTSAGSATVFDLDGDGREDVVTWRHAGADPGFVRAFLFEDRAVLARTLGPMEGILSRGETPVFGRDAAGQRILVRTRQDGRACAATLGKGGVPGPPRPTTRRTGGGTETSSGEGDARGEWTAAPDLSVEPLLADLDGDGRPERVTLIR